MLKLTSKPRVQKNRPRTISLARVLDEIRSLRHDLALLLPTERITDYTHPQSILDAHQEAIKQFPPLA